MPPLIDTYTNNHYATAMFTGRRQASLLAAVIFGILGATCLIIAILPKQMHDENYPSMSMWTFAFSAFFSLLSLIMVAYLFEDVLRSVAVKLWFCCMRWRQRLRHGNYPLHSNRALQVANMRRYIQASTALDAQRLQVTTSRCTTPLGTLSRLKSIAPSKNKRTLRQFPELHSQLQPLLNRRWNRIIGATSCICWDVWAVRNVQ